MAEPPSPSPPASQPSAPSNGLRCRFCGSPRLNVLYVRHRRDAAGGYTLRVRICRSCGLRRLTRER